MPQDNVPTDISAAVGAVARKARLDWVKKWRDDIFKAIMGNKLPVQVEGEDRSMAVDIHQLRAGEWSGSQQYLHKIGRLPTADCFKCEKEECPAGRCLICQVEADTPEHIIIRCQALWERRQRLLGDPPDLHRLRENSVMASLVSGYRALQSLAAIRD